MKELSHEPCGELVDGQHDVTPHQAVALSLVEVHQGILADLVERQRGPAIAADGLEIAEELEHHSLGIP